MQKPIVYISKCLSFAPVRYNGQVVPSDFVDRLKPFIIPITHCPEYEIGLGVPRETVRLVASDPDMKEIRLVQPATGTDLTEKMNDYAVKTLSAIKEVDGFLVKSKSPSSAFKDAKVYYPSAKGSTVLTSKSPGAFGRYILEMFPDTIVEDDMRLTNAGIRDHFCRVIFTMAEFRDVKASGKIKNLMKFQEENKLQFMAYNQTLMRQMGKISANSKGAKFSEVITEYEALLRRLLKKQYTEMAVTNVLEHAFGYFKSGLSAEEKKYFLSLLEKYRKGNIPLALVSTLLRSYIIRFNQKYLASQRFFDPYPEELV